MSIYPRVIIGHPFARSIVCLTRSHWVLLYRRSDHSTEAGGQLPDEIARVIFGDIGSIRDGACRVAPELFSDYHRILPAMWQHDDPCD